MNSKRTHKLAAMGDAGAVVAGSPSVTIAARRLKVARKTVYAWIKAGKVPKPGGSTPAVTSETVTGGQTPAAWAAKVRAERELDATGSALLDLAVGALTLTAEGIHPAIRLSATTRFQALVRQLRLDGQADAEPEDVRKDAEPIRVPRMRRITHDPRQVLMAVK